MQDKLLINMVDDYLEEQNPQKSFKLSTDIVEKVDATQLSKLVARIYGGFQSVDAARIQQYILLLYQLSLKFKSELSHNNIIQKINETLSGKNALSKQEQKIFMMTKYQVYSFLEAPKLISVILNDFEQNDQEYIAFLLVKNMNSQNVKAIQQKIKDKLKTFNHRLFSILVAIKSHSESPFIWDKLLQDKIFNRTKFLELIKQVIEDGPKKILFYKQLANYMEGFKDLQEGNQIYQDFWTYLFSIEDLKLQYFILNVFKNFLKTTIYMSNYKNQELIELWYRSQGTSNKTLKKLAHKIETQLIKKELDYDFIVFIRSIYGHRLNPKSAFAQQMFSKFQKQEFQQYFKHMRQLYLHNDEVQKKLYFLNEIYVLASCCFSKLPVKEQARYTFFILEKGAQHELFYDSLSEENRNENDINEVKKKLEDQTQSFYFSLVSRAFEQKDTFKQFVDELYQYIQKSEAQKFITLLSLYELINKFEVNPQLQTLITSVFSFSLVYAEEGIQILEDLKQVAKLQSGEEPKVQKKVKKDTIQNKEYTNKVLIEIFIQLLTKSPSYLREAINQYIKVMNCDVDSFDILLEVLIKDDHEYVKEMQLQENDEKLDDEESIVIEQD
ncbi:hypothetical protein pb186bvf_010432 [Paramecium bursaria]